MPHVIEINTATFVGWLNTDLLEQFA